MTILLTHITLNFILSSDHLQQVHMTLKPLINWNSTNYPETLVSHTSILSQGKVLVSRSFLTYTLPSYQKSSNPHKGDNSKIIHSQTFWNSSFSRLTISAAWSHDSIQRMLLHCFWDCTWSLGTQIISCHRLMLNCRGLCEVVQSHWKIPAKQLSYYCTFKRNWEEVQVFLDQHKLTAL